MRWSGIVTLMICAICLAGQVEAQTNKSSAKKPSTKKSSKQVEKKDKSISVAKKGKSLHPTANLDPGSVGYYFYPITPGSYWKMRTVKSLYNAKDSLLASDTLFHRETVTTNSAPSMQGLPLIKCVSKSFRPGQLEDSAVAQEVSYYVDDSLIMAVFNNSITHNQNVALLTSPLRKGLVWPEHHEDTIGTMVVSLDENVETPAGKFEHAVLTSTRLGYGELLKYFVGGKGIVKMVFNGVTNGGRGRMSVTTELMDIHHELSHMEGSPDEPSESKDPTMSK